MFTEQKVYELNYCVSRKLICGHCQYKHKERNF